MIESIQTDRLLFAGQEFSCCVPVGHIWKFDLGQRKKHDFGVKWNFSKIRFEHVMLKFLATTENIRRNELQSRESSRKNSWKLLFAISRYKIIRE